MNIYNIYEVNNLRAEKDFLNLPLKIYKGDKNWIRPLDKDIKNVFDPTFNKQFRTGECIRWILTNQKHETVGRVAAFYDKKGAFKNDQPTGGMGFFECINDKEAAFLLFDACCYWLKDRGMEAVDGPINFGERDRWWGLLIEGYAPANYLNNYNPQYYQAFFDEYGFRDYFKQFTFGRSVSADGVNPVIWEKAERLMRNPDYTFKHYEKNNQQKYMADFLTIYNKGWAKFPGVRAMTDLHVKGIFNSIKPILDPRLLWYAYYKDEPVAFFLMLPEINPIIRHLNGKMNIIGKLKFLYYLWRKECFKAFGFVFGVVPEMHGKGVEAGIIKAFARIAINPDFPYKKIEMNWIGDFNPAMIHLLEELGAKPAKIHITYRYLFNPAKEFKRHPKLSEIKNAE